MRYGIPHGHADHVHGIDDLRSFTARQRRDIPAFVPQEYDDLFRTRFSYIFDDDFQPPEGTTKPRVRLKPFGPEEATMILGQRFEPVVLPHGPVTVYGFRVGSLGYVTDAKELPEAALKTLKGVSVLVLNALWFGRPHPTHFNVEEAVETAGTVGAERTYLVHLTHRVSHEELVESAPRECGPCLRRLEHRDRMSPITLDFSNMVMERLGGGGIDADRLGRGPRGSFPFGL